MKKFCKLLVLSSAFASMGAFADSDTRYSRLSDFVQHKIEASDSSIYTEAWIDSGDPLNVDVTRSYKFNLSSLPKNGALKTAPWSDTYWPSYKGGIGCRWQESTVIVPKYPTLANLRRNPSLIDNLSPAEKFDIYMGDFNYTLTKSEEARTAQARANPDKLSWEGLCHAWAPVSYLFKEPGTAKMKSKNSLPVTFFASDVKALLIYAQHYSHDDIAGCQAGLRCFDDNRIRANRDFRDINPGSFHIILTNQIGIQKKGFVFDREAKAQVWNQPVFEYHVLSMVEVPKAMLPATALTFPIAEGAVKFYQVKTKVIYGQEVVPSRDKNTEIVSDENIYDYILDVNANGQIVGGSWMGESIKNHPDFVWVKEAVSAKTIAPSLKSILEIYKKAAGGISSLNNKHESKKETPHNGPEDGRE